MPTKEGFEHPKFMEIVGKQYPEIPLREHVILINYGEAPLNVELKATDGPFGFELRKWDLPNPPPTYDEIEAKSNE